MKALLKPYFLTHPARRIQGFTLVELLVSIIILGILAAIAQPAFLSYARKAREAHAKEYIGQVNRAQQLHYLEFNQFGNLPDLGMDDTIQYYRVTTVVGPNEVMTLAEPHNPDLHGFAGIVSINVVNDVVTSQSELCEGTLGRAPARTDC